MKEKREQSIGCFHHIVILLPKQQGEPAAQVSDLLQVGAAPLQEAPQLLHVHTFLQPCKPNHNEQWDISTPAATCWQHPSLQPVQRWSHTACYLRENEMQ